MYTETRGNVPPLVHASDRARKKRQKELETALAAAAKKRGDKKEIEKLTKEKEAFANAITSVMVMEDTAKPRPTYVLKRGRYDMPDKSHPVEPGVPGSLPPLPKGAGTNRLGLAAWLCSPAKPAHGRGWPSTGSGSTISARAWSRRPRISAFRASRRRIPELLDWLASELIRSGWDVKALHRLIVTSATFRQRSQSECGRCWLATRKTDCWRADRDSACRPRWCATMPWRSPGCSSSSWAARRSSRISRPVSGKSSPAAR